MGVYDDVECPYCGAGQEINHDDGYGYEEDGRHEQDCGSCEKTFVYTTAISFYYDASKADCLNGEEHTLKPSTTYPACFTQMRCVDCDYKRELTNEEYVELGIETKLEYMKRCDDERPYTVELGLTPERVKQFDAVVNAVLEGI